MAKKIRVKYRMLGKEQADGRATSKVIDAVVFDAKDGMIELDERLKGKKLFSALLHEALHHSLPTTHEDEILRIEKEITPIMWPEIKKHPDKYLKGIKI